MNETWPARGATGTGGTALRDAGVSVTAATGSCLVLAAWLDSPAALAGAGVGVGIVIAVGVSLMRRPGRWCGPADRVSLVRCVLAAACATAAGAIVAGDLPARTWSFLLLAVATLLLDAVDGAVARRTGTSSAAGGRLDGELDAAVYLVLSVALAPTAGGWVLAIGLMRYAFAVAGWVRPKLREPLSFSRFRRTVAALQAVFIGVALVPVVPVGSAQAGLALALALLTCSFAGDVVALERRGRAIRPRTAGAVRVPVG